MVLENATWPTVFAPVALVYAIVCVLPSVLPMQRPWARRLVLAAVAAAMLRYLYWRVSETLITEGAVASVWSSCCFLVELIAMWDGALLFLAFLRNSDRGAEADRGEATGRGLVKANAPKVDVLIPTYDEPLDVLEKTIIGALSLDWPNCAIYVLDDSRRAWLRDFCRNKGVGYITRPDNKGAKAGNINHALKVTNGEFVAIFDADFVPQRPFLRRVMGFFEDPKVGIVQTPHAFYNHDPMQTNLSMRKSLPDDQRFFFESIMPARDGWDAAFCCGSNSVTRRSALELAGGALPEGSITEDMLLSLVLLREGFITRYLNERLAYGLAPESVSAFFVQRQRWARGAIQILYLRSGPLGPGLQLVHRLLFMPTHWFTHSLMTLMSMLIPVVFLLTGLPPMQHITLVSAIHYLGPLLIAIFGGLMAFAPGRYHPLAAQVLGTFQSFKLLPTIVATFIKPHGHAFKVTPKGADAAGGYERGILLTCLALIGLTLLGMFINLVPELRQVDDVALVPLVASWCAVNLIVLTLVSLLCLQMPVRRQEERFELSETVVLRHPATGTTRPMISIDISLSGVGLSLGAETAAAYGMGDAVETYVSSVGWIPGRIARTAAGLVGVAFDQSASIERDLLVRKLFTGGMNTAADIATTSGVVVGMLKRIWTADMQVKNRVMAVEADGVVTQSIEKLTPRTLVILPGDGASAMVAALAKLDRAA